MKHYENLSLSNLREYVKGVGWVYEEWADITGYEKIYAVSTFGRVRSYSRLVWQPQMSRYAKRKERILKQKKCSDGYLAVTLSVDKEKKHTGVHRLVALMFVENPKDKPEVNHLLGDKKQNRPEKLGWVTDRENCIHAIKFGLDSVIGERNGRSKLTEKDVLNIRAVFKNLKKGGKMALAKKYNILPTTLRKIAVGELWKHLKL
jgi:hypothetical protein